MDKPIKIAALGDISLDEEIIPDPFEHVRRYLERFDIVFGNLETVLTKEDKHLEKRTALKSHLDNGAEGLLALEFWKMRVVFSYWNCFNDKYRT